MANNLSTIDRYGRRSIYDILSLLGSQEYNNKITDQYGETRREYEAVGISEVKISGIPFTNYGQYSFIWEKTFVKEPKRSGAGNLGNLNSYSTFLTPHLILNFSLMSIDDYREIMKLHYESNEYTVECYAFIYNRKIKAKMYFATEEMAKLYTIAQHRLGANGEWEDWVDLVGVSDYSVELIGTNNELDLVSVRYEYNSDLTPTGAPIPPQYEEDTYLGEEIVIGGNSSFPSIPPSNEWQFNGWNTQADGSGTPYTNGRVVTVNTDNFVLYAQWIKTQGQKLSYNYGLSAPHIKGYDTNTGAPINQYEDDVEYGKPIPTLPPITAEPTVEIEGVEYPAYENGGWYRHPIKDKEVRVNSGEAYWLERDTIIYCLYDKKKFQVTYYTNDTTLKIQTQSIAYGEPIYQPELFKDGYTIQGWYKDVALTKKLGSSEKMPPFEEGIKLYAKWSKQ